MKNRRNDISHNYRIGKRYKQTTSKENNMTIKQQTILSILAITLMSTSTYAWKIVYDPTAVSKAIKQITIMKDQLEKAKKTAMAMNGIKDAVKMYNDVKELTRVMNEYKVTLDDLDIDHPKSKIGLMAKRIFEENQVFDNCNVEYLSKLQQEVCKNNQIRNVNDIAASVVYSDELEKVQKRLQDLSKKLANSKDIKTSQDIGNAINLELAQLEMTKSRIEMMKAANEARRKADQDRLNQEADEKRGIPIGL